MGMGMGFLSSRTVGSGSRFYGTAFGTLEGGRGTVRFQFDERAER